MIEKYKDTYLKHIFSRNHKSVTFCWRESKTKSRHPPTYMCSCTGTCVHIDSCLGSPVAPRRFSLGPGLNHHRQIWFQTPAGDLVPQSKTHKNSPLGKLPFLERIGILLKVRERGKDKERRRKNRERKEKGEGLVRTGEDEHVRNAQSISKMGGDHTRPLR